MLEAEATRCMSQGQGTLWPLSCLQPKHELKNKKFKKAKGSRKRPAQVQLTKEAKKRSELSRTVNWEVLNKRGLQSDPALPRVWEVLLPAPVNETLFRNGVFTGVKS